MPNTSEAATASVTGKLCGFPVGEHSLIFHHLLGAVDVSPYNNFAKEV
ncbi:hypothetical protein [Maridesulfovibrio sp.]|nr:hypothetical protein [Maridesulfovibrio sp.]